MIFNPLQAWTQEITIKRSELKAQHAELSKAQQIAIEKRAALNLNESPNIITAFNLAYTPDEFLTSAGYDQRGNSFRHPGSESGNYSATVRLDDSGVLRVNTLSTEDPLYVKGSKSGHDAFGTFCTLHHGGNINEALKDAGDNLLTIGSVSYNKAVRREHMQRQAEQQQQQKQKQKPGKAQSRDQPVFTGDKIDLSNEPNLPPIGYEKPPNPKQSEDKTPFTLAQFSISGDSIEMRKQMLGTKYVIDRIAIRGQSTVIFAKYNTGKTLLVLRGVSQSIEKGVIDGNDVYYINADDDFDGLTTKTEIAERYRFHMLTPGFKDFNPSAMQGYMRQMIEDGTAEKSVLILDTLKKFIDQMSKSKQSEFTTRMGEFITARGTVIMLSHVNKNRDENGKVVHCGTSDIPDDTSCVFMLDEINTTKSRKQVLFENIKNRGVVARELAFSYSIEEGLTYREIFDSVQVETEASSAQAKAELEESIKFERNKAVINSIVETIKASIVNKTDLIKAVQEDTGVSKPRITSVLNDYCEKKWQVSIGDKNAKTYTLITNTQATENEYRHYRDGE